MKPRIVLEEGYRSHKRFAGWWWPMKSRDKNWINWTDQYLDVSSKLVKCLIECKTPPKFWPIGQHCRAMQWYTINKRATIKVWLIFKHLFLFNSYSKILRFFSFFNSFFQIFEGDPKFVRRFQNLSATLWHNVLIYCRIENTSSARPFRTWILWRLGV